MRRTIKALEDELSTATEKYEKAEREVSLFDEQFFTSYADVQNFSVWPARVEQNNK